MNYFEIYLLIINFLTLLIFGIDKVKAKRKYTRISEKGLFILCFLGGGTGGFIGMYLFKHKTKKWYFNLLVPISIAIWTYIWWNYLR